jgi:hypothetical protein
MRIEGENWDDWIYPFLFGPKALFARSLISRELLARAAAAWLALTTSTLSSSYFKAVAQAGGLVLGQANLQGFLRAHLRFIAQFYLEMADMIELGSDAIKGRLLPRIKYRFDGLDIALQSGRGILMPTLQTAVPLRMIFSNFPKGGKYNLILHRQNRGIVKMLEKADSGWTFIFLEDSPARRIVGALKRGEVIICNIDHAYPDTEVTLAPVLGRPAIVPSGAFRMAHKFHSLVVPLTFTEEGINVVMTAERVLEWDAAEIMPVARMLERVHPILDGAVLQAPAQWFGWGNLVNRWHAWKDYVDDAA